jgi:hypothetical protein
VALEHEQQGLVSHLSAADFNHRTDRAKEQELTGRLTAGD